MEDAAIALISMGSPSGTAKAVIDSKRDAGMKVGLVKIRALRPFPKERLAKVRELWVSWTRMFALAGMVGSF